MAIRVACQTYTWEMLGSGWSGSLNEICREVAATGYQGIEISSNILGALVSTPHAVRELLAVCNLELAALAFAMPSGFTEPDALATDLAQVETAIEFLKFFPGAKLALGGASSPTRENMASKRQVAYTFYNAAGKKATEAGISCNVHPHSHHGSLFETEAEYQELLISLDPQYVSFGPDSGHITRSGQDLVSAVKMALPRITHIHFKDCDQVGHDAQWAPVGKGVCDFALVLQLLAAAGYDGWVVCEEESQDARDAALRPEILRCNRDCVAGLLAALADD